MKSLLKQFYTRPLVTFFLLICLIITSLSVSIISSMIDKEKMKMREDNIGFKYDAVLSYALFSDNRTLKDLDEISSYKNYESCFNTQISLEKGLVPISIIKVNFNYLNKLSVSKIIDEKDMKNSIAVGVKLYEKLGKPNTINIFKKTYKVSHVVGMKNEKTSFESSIIMNYSTLNEEDKKSFVLNDLGNLKLFGIKNKEEEGDKIENSFHGKSGFEIQNTEITNPSETKTAYKKQKDSIIAQILLIVIGLCNILIVSTFWVIDRMKEIAIRKAFGSDKKHITLLIFKELFLLSIAASFIAIIIQRLLTFLGGKYFNFSLNPSITNLIVVSCCSFVISIAAAVIPVKRALRMEISQCLKQ